MTMKYKTYDELPTSITDFVLTASGESNIKSLSLHDINTFIETIAYINQKKYVVLRMGKSTKYNIDYENEYFIDYANSNWRSDKMDYFLGFKTVLCITTNTGMDSFARLFRKPIAQITTPLADLFKVISLILQENLGIQEPKNY